MKQKGMPWRIKESLKDFDYAADIILLAAKADHIQEKLDRIAPKASTINVNQTPYFTISQRT